MKKIVGLCALALSLSANVAVTGDAYKKIANDKIEIIYASEYETLSKKAMQIEEDILKTYTDSYGFSLDDKQYVGLLSSHNQVANAFSTQLPFNSQINYGGGAMLADYFASTSWFSTLLWHESAHNFQLNPKKNLLAYYAHKIVGNSIFTFLPFLYVPIFPIPNAAESSFMTEGNAVLNESWHNNGGRLYNGALLAMAVTQARAGYITPERTYNEHLYFPYGTHHYIVGGFFHLFLAQRYGIDKVNSYFYNYSGQWIPIFTNAIFKETFGVDFEESIEAYSAWMLEEYAGFQASEGKLLVTSKSSVKLNSDHEEIYFLISDFLSAPKLVHYDKKSAKIRQERGNYLLGKVFKKEGKYYSLASSHTSAQCIMIGLYDEEAAILKESAGKVMQSLSLEGNEVYFDVKSSFDEPMMYVDGEFYAKVNSSVFSHDARHYYFVQEGKRRTLYENKTPLFSFQGWYGFVCGRDENGIYFIANTQNGSGLFRFKDGEISRVSRGDDIIDARLIDTTKALVETMGAEGVSFKEVLLEANEQSVKEVRYFFEDTPRFYPSLQEENITKSSDYAPFLNMRYSSMEYNIVSNGKGIDFDITASFADALSQNSVSLFTARMNDNFIAGVGYDSSAYRVNFGANVFAVIDHEKDEDYRGFGSHLYLSYPWLHTTYEKLDVKLSYHVKALREEKEPLTLTFDYRNQKQFGQSMYLNEDNSFKLSLGLDREDKIVGAKYHFQRDLGKEFYAGFDISAALSDTRKEGTKRGVKIEQKSNDFSDALNFEMPSITEDAYVKKIIKGGVSLAKVFNGDAYFFTFPLSLRREALYAKYNYYKLETLPHERLNFDEIVLGVRADLLLFNSLPFPISVEYIHNDDLVEVNEFRALFSLQL